MSSRVNGSPLLKWKRNGDVERVIHRYMVANERTTDKNDDEFDIEEKNPELDAEILEAEKDCENGANCNNLPPLHKFQIKIAYGKGVLEKFDNSDEKLKAMIESMMVHVQVAYCHSSL